MGAINGLRAEIEDIEQALRRVFDKLDAIIVEREELGKRWLQDQEEIARLRDELYNIRSHSIPARDEGDA